MADETYDLSVIEGLLALLVLDKLKDDTDGEKYLKLSQAGLSNVEIAKLVGKTRNTVNVQLHNARRRPKSKKKTATKKKGQKAKRN
jgi:DNA-binding CsgD family transcriptional regulator